MLLRCHKTNFKGFSSHNPVKSRLLHMHCQDSCCAEHLLSLKSNLGRYLKWGAKGCLIVSPACNSWIGLKRRMQGCTSISHLSQMFYFQTSLPSGNAGDAGHGQPLPSSIWITNGFYLVIVLCLVFLLCVLIQVRWDL